MNVVRSLQRPVWLKRLWRRWRWDTVKSFGWRTACVSCMTCSWTWCYWWRVRSEECCISYLEYNFNVNFCVIRFVPWLSNVLRWCIPGCIKLNDILLWMMTCEIILKPSIIRMWFKFLFAQSLFYTICLSVWYILGIKAGNLDIGKCAHVDHIG